MSIQNEIIIGDRLYNVLQSSNIINNYYFINNGGYIWLAKHDSSIIGSSALIKEHDGVFELAKMSVAGEWQGKGISKLLIEVCLAKARELKAKKVELFSNHQLLAALKLYERYGFRHVEIKDSPFETADVKMELIIV